MYKYLLCLRYLRTRYIALASIISVMLGVATMIVVNSVMEGFTGEMQNRIHSILGDLVVKSQTMEGMPNFEQQAARIRAIAGDDIQAMSPIVGVPAVLYFERDGHTFTRQIDLVGIDEETQSSVSGFGDCLQHPANRKKMSFELRKGGYDVRDHQGDGTTPLREDMCAAGWQRRLENARNQAFEDSIRKPLPQKDRAKRGATAGLSRGVSRHEGDSPVFADTKTGTVPSGRVTEAKGATGQAGGGAPAKEKIPEVDPFGIATHQPAGRQFDPRKQQHTGAVVGIAMASWRDKDGADHFFAVPGDDVKIAMFSVDRPPAIFGDNFTVVDFYESKMSDTDSKYVFVPIRKLQELRGMIDNTTGVANINAIQIKLKPGISGDVVRNKLRAALPSQFYSVHTWREEQGALLDAVDLETRLLNVLLFLIIAVAGFGILAIFYMIVVEKTRDIGILKSLGASRSGVMGIFLGYGLLLGIVGAGVGTAIGLLFVHYINSIANFLAWVTGKPVFDPSIYYFYKIPAIVMPWTVTWIVLGAILIAVAASILPANRAARLHPVEALRYE
jgi:lipoprotein-releasing system permease protein